MHRSQTNPRSYVLPKRLLFQVRLVPPKKNRKIQNLGSQAVWKQLLGYNTLSVIEIHTSQTADVEQRLIRTIKHCQVRCGECL